ncbi:hypothetical protein IWQ56_001732, partial [Coemansia nantahalensis]
MARWWHTWAAAALALASIPLAAGARQWTFAHDAEPTSAQQAVGAWAQAQAEYGQRRILANIAPFADDHAALAGAVCASPSRAHPNYYYVWTRDAALVMGEVLEWLDAAPNGTRRHALEQVLDDYVAFTRHVQGLRGLAYGLGEA